MPEPKEYRGSILSQLLRLHKPAMDAVSGHRRDRSSTTLRAGETVSSGGSVFCDGNGSSRTGSPGSNHIIPDRRKWYEQKYQGTPTRLAESSRRLLNLHLKSSRGKQPQKVMSASVGPSNAQSQQTGSLNNQPQMSNLSRMDGFPHAEEARIAMYLGETLSMQDYIVRLCRALMLYGAPTHRLEEYMVTTARSLHIDGEFLYLPGCMVVSFGDQSTQTTKVSIVRTVQGIDLGKLKDVHRVYKEVMHDIIQTDEAIKELENIIARKEKFSPWLRVLVFGLTSTASAPFSFQARFIDLPIVFCFGCLVSFLQLIVSARSSLYDSVFEVSAVVLVSFLARALGSINGGDLFCFSALVQGGIVMLLPGYLVCKLLVPFNWPNRRVSCSTWQCRQHSKCNLAQLFPVPFASYML